MSGSSKTQPEARRSDRTCSRRYGTFAPETPWWSGAWTGSAESLKDLIARAEDLQSEGVGLKSLKEAIDTDSSSGRLIFHIFGALAEFERALIRERTQAGLQAARARGRKGGRRKRLDRDQRAHTVELYRSRQHTVKQICNLMGGVASDALRVRRGILKQA